MSYILRRNKIFITHLEKCIQTTCLAFTGDVERFENMLCFPSHLHRWMGSLGNSFLLTLVLLCPFGKHLKPTQSLFPFLPRCNDDKLKCFHIFISLTNQCIPKHVGETQQANKAWIFTAIVALSLRVQAYLCRTNWRPVDNNGKRAINPSGVLVLSSKWSS